MLSMLALMLIALAANAAQSKKAGAPTESPLDANKFFAAIVKVQTHATPGARSSVTLGEEREGTGIVIGEHGLILTIGYLIVEADQVEITDSQGRRPAGDARGLRPCERPRARAPDTALRARAAAHRRFRQLAERDPVLIVSHEGREGSTPAFVVAKRLFTGNWEYMLDKAIFTSPPSPNWSGAALIGKGWQFARRRLADGSRRARWRPQLPGNMFVPIDTLKPILADMVKEGHRSGPARPWLGVAADEVQGRLMVTRVSPDSPADKAGLQTGDLILAVAGEPVHSQAEFYRKLWSQGAAGTEIPLRLLQGVDVRELKVQSIDRVDYFRPRRRIEVWPARGTPPRYRLRRGAGASACHNRAI